MAEKHPPPSPVSYLLSLLLVGAIYYVLANLGLRLASVHPAASPVWAPSGVALAAMLVSGLRMAPAVFAGAFAANLAIATVPVAAVVAAGNTLEALIMALLLNRFAAGADVFEKPARIARFSAVSLLTGTVIGASIGVGAQFLSTAAPSGDLPGVWATWWLGDSAGTLAVTPVVVLWVQSLRRNGVIFTRDNVAVFLAAAIVGLIAFSPVFEHSFVRVPLAFLTIAPLFAAALRLGQRDTATVAMILSLFAIWGTVTGVGPFAQPTLNNSFLLLLTFMISAMVPSLALSAEVSQRRHAESDLRHQEGELRAVFRQALVGIGECDTEGRFLSANDKLCEMMRRTEEDLLGHSLQDLTDAEDLEKEAALFARARLGEGYVVEKRILWPDSTRRWVRNTVTPVIDRQGGVRRIAVVCEDITQRHHDEERQKLLMAELNHRVRNNLATIQAIARLTARGQSTKAEYVESLQGRIASMARAHSLLTRERWQGANLQDIVRDELSAHSRLHNVTFDGPAITLGTRHALDLALVIHELSTNAVKHGALSVPGGKLTVHWNYQTVDGTPHLILNWEESGGPPVPQPPARKGFGTYLIESAMAGGGTQVKLSFAETGAICSIDMPMARTVTDLTPPPEKAPESKAGEIKAPEPAPRMSPSAAIRTAANLQTPGQMRRKVLLVEDDAVLGFELQSALAESGLEVIGPARTVEEALRLAGDRQLSAAVLDIHLGGVMVFPVAEYLRGRNLPILFITGYDIENVAPETLRNAPVMQKPVNADELVGRIRSLMPAA